MVTCKPILTKGVPVCLAHYKSSRCGVTPASAPFMLSALHPNSPILLSLLPQRPPGIYQPATTPFHLLLLLVVPLVVQWLVRYGRRRLLSLLLLWQRLMLLLLLRMHLLQHLLPLLAIQYLHLFNFRQAQNLLPICQYFQHLHLSISTAFGEAHINTQHLAPTSFVDAAVLNSVTNLAR